MHAHHSFDLIHAHTALPCGAAALSLSKRIGLPFVVTVHGLDAYFAEQTGPRIGKWCERISKQVYESASKVICISEKVRERVTEIAHARTTVVYNGVDPTLFAPSAENQSSPFVLSVGNLIPIKGHASLLRAFSRISPSAPTWSLEIIGEGPQRGELEGLASNLRITDRVRFRGREDRDEVAVAMQRCSIFALPSIYEALGCVYLEAMACGKPAIGCRDQGIDEIVQHGRNGLLVSPGCESGLADALAMLSENEELRRRIGSGARQTVLSRHTLAHQATQLAQIYQECVL
jgi:glycosyltransferase involved in cell wall biosynthesis